MEQKHFQEMMAYLAAAYDEEITRDRAGVYWHQLSALPSEPFVEAVYSLVSHSKYFPTVAELREATQMQMRRVEPAPVVRRIEAKKSGMKTASHHLQSIKRRLGRSV